MMISLILCSYNGENRIFSTLEALSKLIPPKSVQVELIFVDSNSDKELSNMVKNHWENFKSPFNLITLRQNKSGKVAALQLGLNKSLGSYFVIVDDDNELEEDYLIQGFEYLIKNPKVGVLGGKGNLPNEEVYPHWFYSNSYYFACGAQSDHSGEVRPERNVVYGAGMWGRKEAYTRALENGFKFHFDFHGSNQSVNNMTNGGEDSELCWAIRFQGYEIHYLDELNFIHRISKEKLNQSHLNLLLERTNKTTLLGFIYLKAQSLQVEKVKFFWLKELLYLIFNYFKNLEFKKDYFTKELNRNKFNFIYLVKNRYSYDELINSILEFKIKSFKSIK
jgi:glycosyltransferase involved in cell wall biosynthesis